MNNDKNNVGDDDGDEEDEEEDGVCWQCDWTADPAIALHQQLASLTSWHRHGDDDGDDIHDIDPEKSTETKYNVHCAVAREGTVQTSTFICRANMSWELNDWWRSIRMVKEQASECQKKDFIESNHCTVWQKIQIRKNNRSTANMQRSDIPQVWNWKTASYS